jgi:CO/xanthine dehydrogenase Mo-binding subunit
LGIKGAGEGGINATGAALATAIDGYRVPSRSFP